MTFDEYATELEQIYLKHGHDHHKLHVECRALCGRCGLSGQDVTEAGRVADFNLMTRHGNVVNLDVHCRCHERMTAKVNRMSSDEVEWELMCPNCQLVGSIYCSDVDRLVGSNVLPMVGSLVQTCVASLSEMRGGKAKFKFRVALDL